LFRWRLLLGGSACHSTAAFAFVGRPLHGRWHGGHKVFQRWVLLLVVGMKQLPATAGISSRTAAVITANINGGTAVAATEPPVVRGHVAAPPRQMRAVIVVVVMVGRGRQRRGSSAAGSSSSLRRSRRVNKARVPSLEYIVRGGFFGVAFLAGDDLLLRELQGRQCLLEPGVENVVCGGAAMRRAGFGREQPLQDGGECHARRSRLEGGVVAVAVIVTTVRR